MGTNKKSSSSIAFDAKISFLNQLEQMVDSHDVQELALFLEACKQSISDYIKAVALQSDEEKQRFGLQGTISALAQSVTMIDEILSEPMTTFSAETSDRLKSYFKKMIQLLNLCSDTFSSIHYKPSSATKHPVESQEPSSEKGLEPARSLLLAQTNQMLFQAGFRNARDVSTFSQVAHTSGYTPDRSDFAHIHGEYFLQNTGLEGNQMLKMARVFHAYLNQSLTSSKSSNDAKHGIERLANLTQRGMNFEEKVDNVKEFATFKAHFSELIDSLKPSEEAIIFGGWAGTNNAPGHAIYYKLTKQDDEHFSFKVYNRGSGVNAYHPEVTINGYDKKYQMFLERTDVSRESLLSQAFLKPLIELRSLPQSNTTDYSADDVYDSLLNGLDGKPVSQTAQLDSFTTPQHSGVCAWSGLMAMAQDALSPEEYTLFEHRVKLQSLIDFYNTNKQQVEFDNQLSMLLQYSLQQFAQETILKHAKGVLTDEEYHASGATILQISHEISAVLTQSANQHHTTAWVVSLKRALENPPKVIPALPEIPITTMDEALTLPASTYDYPPVEGLSMVEILNKSQAFCETLLQQKDYRALGAYITQIFETLPVPKGNDSTDFWTQLSIEDRDACRGKIVYLSEKLLRARQKLPKNKHQSIEDIINLQKAFLIQHRIAVLSNSPPGIVDWQMTPLEQFEDCFRFTRGSTNYTPKFGDTNVYDEKYRKMLSEIDAYASNFTSIEIRLKKRIPGLNYDVPFSLDASHLFSGSHNWNVLDNYLKTLLQEETVKNKLDALPELDCMSPSDKQAKSSLQSLKGKTSKTAIEFREIFESQSMGYQMVKALFYAKEILPESFTALREQATLTQYFLIGDVHSEKLIDSDSTSPLTYSVSLGNYGQHQFKINGSLYTIDESNTPSQEFEHITKDGSDYHFPLEISNPNIRIFMRLTQNQLASENIAAVRAFDAPILGRHAYFANQEVRELLRLRSVFDTDEKIKGYKKKQVGGQWQPPKILSYFEEHFQKLQDPEYRKLLKILLLECDYLEAHLAIAPEFAKKINDYFDGNRQRCLDAGEYKMASYFLDMWRRVNRRMGTANEALSTVRKEQAFLTTVRMSGHSEEISLGCQNLIVAFEDIPRPLTKMEASELLWAYCYYQSHPISAELVDAFLANQVSKVMEARRGEIARLCDDKNHDVFINRIVRPLMEKDTGTYHWITEHFPICTSEDGRYTFNVMQGTLSVLDRLYEPLPASIRDDVEFKRVFANRSDPLYKRLTASSFESLDGLVRLHMHDGHLTIQKKLDMVNWYQYIPHQSLPKELVDALDKPDFFEHYTQWVSCSPTDEKSILFVDKRSPEACMYEIPINATHQYVTRRDGLVLLQPNLNEENNACLRMFPRIENLSYVHVWGLGTDMKEVELPRLGLHFQIQKNQDGVRAYSTELSDFFLADNQSIRGMKGFYNYLVLENSKGVKKVIIPNQKIPEAKDIEGALSSSIVLSQNPETMEPRYFSFDVDKQGRLRTSKVEENLFMTYLLLGKKDYDAAATYLRDYIAASKSYSPLAESLFLRLQELHTGNKDGHPKASAVYLCAIAAFFKNRDAFSHKEDKDIETKMLNGLTEEYLRYLTVAQQTTSVALLPEEELLLIRYMQKEPRILARKKQLEANTALDLNAIEYANPVKKEQIDQSSASLNLTSAGILKVFCELSVYKYKEPFDLLNYSFLRPGNKVDMHFTLFYQWAKQGTEDQKAFLKDALRLMRYDDTVNHNLRYYLQAVLEQPDDFPAPNFFLGFDISEAPNYNMVASPTAEQIALIASLRIREKIEIAILRQKDKEALNNTQTLFSFPANELPETQVLTSSVIHVDEKNNPMESTQNHLLGQDLPKMNEISLKHLSKLKAQLAALQSIEYRHLYTEEAKIRLLLNREPTSTLDALGRRLQVTGTLRPILQINDCIPAFLHQDKQAFKALNPALTDEEIHELNERLYQYFETTTRQQQISRALVQFEKVETLVEDGEGEPSPILEAAKSKFNAEASTVRCYDAARYPENLVLESFSNLLLRPQQKNNLDKMLSQKGVSPNIILQMVMGSGKSKVLLPIWALKKADGDRLPIIVVPDALYETTLENMRQSSHGAFAQKLFTIDIDRSTEFSTQKLSSILALLEQVRAERGYLILTPKSLHCLKLKLCEAMLIQSAAKTSPPALNESIQLAKKILSCIKTKGDAIVDEADTIFNCRQEVNFTLGTPASMNPNHVRMVTDIYRCMMSMDAFRHSIINTDESYAPITESNYHTTLKPLLLKKVLQAIAQSSAKNRLGEFLSHLPNAEKECMHNYLMGKKDTVSSQWLQQQKEDVRDLLSILQEELNTLLPLTLTRQCNVHYGQGVNPDKPLAVPYHGNNTPSLTSEFGNHYEVLNYTLQTYMNKNIPLHIIEKDIRMLQRGAMSELKNNKGRPIEQTAAYKTFLNVYGEFASSLGLMRLDEDQISQVASKINCDYQKKIVYLEAVVLPELQIFPEKLNANPLELVEMFSSCQGFTGTPWNSDCFHDKLTTILDEVEEQQTLAILKRKCDHVDKVQSLHDASFPAVLHELFSLSKADVLSYRAIIDTGALFHGVANEVVARELLDIFLKQGNASPVKGVIFMKDDEPFILEKGMALPIPLSKSTLSENERFTYYDQRHTLGIDIKQAPFAKAYVTVGKDTMQRDLLQGAWRMRDIENNQDISFLVLPETRQLAHQIFNISPDKMDFNQLMQLVGHNESKQQKEHLIVSIQQKIRLAVMSEIEDILLNADMDEDTQKRFVLKLKAKHLLSVELGDKPFLAFGLPNQTYASSQVIADFISKMKGDITEILALLDEPIRLEAEMRIAKKMEAIQTPHRLALLPPEIPSFMQTNPALQQEVMTEVKQEVRQEIQYESQVQTMGYRHAAIPLQHWSWGNIALKGNYRKPIYDRPISHDMLQPISINDILGDKPSIRLPESKPAEVYNWNLSVQVTLKTSWDATIAYIEKECFAQYSSLFFKHALSDAEKHVLHKVFNEQEDKKQGDEARTLTDDEEIIFQNLYQEVEHRGKAGLLWDLLSNKYDIQASRTVTPPVLYAGDLFATNPLLKQYQTLFDKRLQTTYNFSPTQNFSDSNEVLDEPFHLIHPENFLIVKDRSSNSGYRMIFLSLSDVQFFSGLLAKEQQTSGSHLSPDNLDLGIYNLNLGMVQSGKNAITDQELEQNTEFQQVLVQAKFLSGVIHYTDQEQALLYDWLKAFPPQQIESFFTGYILKHAPEKRRLYPESAIKLMFDKLSQQAFEHSLPSPEDPLQFRDDTGFRK